MINMNILEGTRSWHRLWGVFLSLLIFSTIISPHTGMAFDSGGIMVKTDKGFIVGVEQNNVRIFRGIPYAKPPVGGLRWRKPQEHHNWVEPRDASKFGPVCLQPKRKGRAGRGVDVQSEDCLTINVWAPQTIDKLAPVMVWIHGGAFRMGAGSLPFYDGTSFAQKGVILVTLNYRLGNFGFFGHPSITSGNEPEISGNFGIQDQIAALKWVKNNIFTFGGDPDQVTIFGESAGAVSVNYLMIAPQSKGLFHRAISESGGGFQIATHQDERRGRKPPEQKRTRDLANKWGVSQGPEEAKALRHLPAEVILGEKGFSGGIGNGPYIDGTIILEEIGQAFDAGMQHDIPYMVGANSYEGSLMRTIKMKPRRALATFGKDKKKVTALYKDTGNDKLAPAQVYEIYGDAVFVAPARFLAETMRKKNAKAWLYHFSYVLKRRQGKVPGAKHGSEIPFVFASLDKLPMARLLVSDEDRKMSENIHSYWINFARNGNPNADEQTFWPAYNAQDAQTLEFAIPGIGPKKDFKSKKLDFHIERYKARQK